MITNKDLSIDSENGKITLNGNNYDFGSQGEIDADVKDVYAVMGQMGAKNLNIFPYKNGGAGDTWEANGITYTVKADGTLEADGTATADAYFRFGIPTDDFNPIYLEEGKSYILSGIGTSDIEILLRDSTNTNIAYAAVNDTLYNCTTSGKYYLLVRVKNGKTVNHATIKPMLRLASDTDNTYQPYAKTNRQLTEVIGDLAATGVTGDTVAAQIKALKDAIATVTNA